MSETPVPRNPGRDEDPPGMPAGPGDHPSLGSPGWRLVPCRPDWDEVYLAAIAEDECPGDADLYEDPDNAPAAGLDDAEMAALIAAARENAEDQARVAEAAARLGQTAALAAVGAVAAGRRGPGMPGSAESFPGDSGSQAAGFASGKPLDVAPGCATLGSFLEDLGGEDDRYAGASDDELQGMICGWERDEANACARKHAAIAELIRRRPAEGCEPQGPAQMPEGWSEFTGRELGAVLGVSAGDAEEMLDLAHALEVNLPGTKQAFRAGILNLGKARVIAAATALLDPCEARAAEAVVLGRAGSLTPAQLRGAIKRAVMEVAPKKARERREHMAKRTRVERWSEDSGNAGLAGRELPPAQVLAADQRVTAWAKELRKAGLDGDMDVLRARAFLDILLGMDSRPPGTKPDGSQAQAPGPAAGAGAGPGGAAGRGDPARIRRAGEPDHPGHYCAGPGGPARGDERDRADRPRPGPGSGPRGGPQRPVPVVRDRDRPGGARGRARLCPARSRRRPR